MFPLALRVTFGCGYPLGHAKTAVISACIFLLLVGAAQAIEAYAAGYSV